MTTLLAAASDVSGATASSRAGASGAARELPRRTLFFLLREPDLPGAAPAVVALVSTCWTRFLRERAGLRGEPFFGRPSHECEPDTHANGHPYAWLYRDVGQVLLDERRLSSVAAGEAAAERMCEQLAVALREAMALTNMSQGGDQSLASGAGADAST